MAEQEERKAVRFSARPPARFAKGADFNLWVKRLELYFREAKVPDNKRGEELVALLEDDAFRVVSQSGFVSGDGVEYEEVKKCLQEQYAPKGVELEWQRKLHSAHQERPETLLEFSGRLRMLADKAYPSWSAERRLEMAREQFIHGVISPSVQMRLLRKQPESLEAALDLASQWESVESWLNKAYAERNRGQVRVLPCQVNETWYKVHCELIRWKSWRYKSNSCHRRLGSCQVGKSVRKGALRKGSLSVGTASKKGIYGAIVLSGRNGVYLRKRLGRTGYGWGRPTRMLVDTGSSVTLVHEKVWNDISQDRKLLTPQCPVMAVNGDSLSLCGQIDLDLMVGKHETAVVPPYHEMRLQVQLEGAKTDGDYVGLFQPKAEMSTQRGLLFACSVSPVHDGKAVVQLVNPSAVPVTLHCKEKVGQVSPWDGREGANMVEPALGTRLPARSTEAIGKAVGELMGDTSGLSREECAKLKTILHHFSDVISVGDTPPVHQPARRLPFHQRDVVQKMIQGMLQQGIIEPSGGAWASPIVLKWILRTRRKLRLKEAGLKIKPSKCHLLCKSVRYLGYVVSEKGIAADADKIKCVENWPTPTDHESLRQFLGFASYYRKFIRNFADTAAPLHALTEKSKPWHWTELYDKAFVALKGKLASPPILSFPQFDRTFVVDADASQEGVGAVLSHLDDGRVIAYASRVLTKAECQYCATRRELLALVWSVRQFRAYLWGRRFIVRTDHSALRWLRSFKDPQGQVARWLEILAEFDFDVIHRPGLRHGNADALSRIQCKQCGMHNGIAMPCLFHNAFGAVNVRDGVLFRQWEDVPGKGCNKHLQLVVPRSWIGSVLQQLHSSPSGGHLGMFKTLEKVRSRFYWPGQRHDIEDWCRACELCAARKSPPRRNRAPMQQVLAGGPFQRVAMDILGPLPLTDRGNKYILVLGDYFTKWVESYPIPNMEAKTIANVFVSHFVSRFGAPDVLHTDQGRNF
eukprot:Em0044g32a